MGVVDKTLEPDDELQDIFKPDDEVQDLFNASYNDKNGYILLSQKKFLFVSEQGFLQKIYDLVLEVPYDRINEIRCTDNGLTLLVWGTKHVFKSDYARVMEQSIKDLKELRAVAS